MTKPATRTCDTVCSVLCDQVRAVVDRHEAHALGQPRGVQLLHRRRGPAAGPRSGSRRGASARCPRSRRARAAGRPWRRSRSAGRAPTCTRPMSRTKIGTPFGASSTMFSRSSVPDRMSPEPRIGSACCPMRSRAPPALRLLFFTASATWRMLEPVLVERSGIDLDLVLADQAAERRHVGHPGHLQQPRADHPVLDLPQAHRVVAGAHDHVPVELADAARQRAEGRRDALGKLTRPARAPARAGGAR